MSEHPDIPATTHVGLTKLGIDSTEYLGNRYTIDKYKYDIKPAVMKRSGDSLVRCPFMISLITNSNHFY